MSTRETPEQRRAGLAARARALAAKREAGRQARAEQLYEQAFQENCDVLRETNSKRMLFRTIEERRAQVRARAAGRVRLLATCAHVGLCVVAGAKGRARAVAPPTYTRAGEQQGGEERLRSKACVQRGAAQHTSRFRNNKTPFRARVADSARCSPIPHSSHARAPHLPAPPTD